MSEINIEEFINVDLRVAKIKEAHEVPDADKLVELFLMLVNWEKKGFLLV